MNLSLDMIKGYLEKGLAFVERMGLQALDLEPRRVKLLAPLRGNENHIGSMYAGALFTLAEMPGGALFLTTFDTAKYYPVVKEMTIQFLRPAKSDVAVELSMTEEEARRIEAEASDKGKAEFILEAELKNDVGEVVARTRGVYQIRRLSG